MTIIDDFIALFFPHYCFCCDELLVRGEDILCTECLLNLPKTNYEQDINPVTEKLVARLSVTCGFAFLKFSKKGIVQRILHRLKYEFHPKIAVKLGVMHGKALEDYALSGRFDLIVPVPLHSSRLRKRGYNQSARFAEGLSDVLTIPWSDTILFRTKRTSTQTRKSASARWESVKDAFFVPDATLVKQKKILLVDDVITTGATLMACGSCLLRAGCAEIGVVCLAEA